MSDIFRDFDKKNEVPKVKIPKFATGGICNDAIFPKLDAFLQIDEIVKDIRDRKDNAMAMEFTKCIGELLKKNGVVPKMTEYRTENHEENFLRSKYEMKYGVSIDELDFSEHDKVFEDKIAEQKNEISTLKSLIDNYRDAESKLFDEKRKLKQRIVELESKESVKTMRIEFYADNGEPFTPLEIASSLINQDVFKVDELKELAEYLQVYCRHHNDREVETISF